ncbi:Gfo/Idh/MocA family protein [Roseivirga spongicola]|uniref:Oxidoreductase n=2 Tax=Roseivirgaceae TaxID=2762306 RepID=A0A150XIC1_9BACT|nr:Gfo/Idh/MocA family oxidoreductase [Roseivirga spongicola]KYG78423.1 oxidoreductase [Roseivirga spongicola]MBO6660754.1 Gfo/Idh/MocA family oxidoreductase [Roseivirga sp.]MBO6909262.1 Gfo/Idh/MocA family oxidoreductase [Roseivirga sp.]WPZ12170.1 Gfo/Idh/MocA family oxidoreductase [Roseivirga spongicola]
MKRVFTFILAIFSLTIMKAQEQNPPVKVAVIGLTHTHVHWILGREDRGDIEIVGIVEPNTDLAERYTKQHGFSMDIVYPTMDALMEIVKPQAVTAFGTIYDHLSVVEFFAPKGIHVMVEKPLAVSLDHAKKMQALAQKHNIHLLTNYETTWYGSTLKAYKMVHQDNMIGDIRKIVVHDGHPGPNEIGVNEEFLEWLTDPKLNGAGALTDFGCYGANLATWLMKGERPQSVFAMTATNKPDIYPKVDDEATIVLQYPKTQVIIQASWNWPVSRKDMEVYGVTGQIIADNGSTIRYQLGDNAQEQKLTDLKKESPNDDPFTLLAAVVRGQITPQDADLSALQNNMVVMEILDAAMQSAKSGKVVKLK